MVIEAETQVTDEQKAPDTNEQVIKEGISGKGSQKAESVSEKAPAEGAEKGEEETLPKITFESQEALDKATQAKAESLANSIANKSTATMQKTLDALTKENTRLKSRAEDREDDKLLANLEKAESAAWEAPTEEVKAIHEVRGKAIDLYRNNRDRAVELDERETDLKTNERQLSASMKALIYLLPDDSEFRSEFDNLKGEMAKCGTEREEDLLIQVKDAERQRKAEAEGRKVKRKPADSSLHSGPGGFTSSKTDPGATIREGFRRLSRK